LLPRNATIASAIIPYINLNFKMLFLTFAKKDFCPAMSEVSFGISASSVLSSSAPMAECH
jgi:hypothetical protein